MSWDSLELGTQEGRADALEEMNRRTADFHAVFGTEAGQRVLGYLREQTIERPICPAQAVDGAAFNALMAIREGENNFYRWIKAQFMKGKK